jgi:hypothetical protein
VRGHVVDLGHPVASDLFRAHAAHLDLLRARFGAVRAASARIERDQAAFGAVCGWIFTGLGDRHGKQDELIAYVEENLLLAADGMRRVADGAQELAELAGEPSDGTTRSPSEVVARVLETVRSREWVEDLLADAAPVAEFAAPVTDLHTVLRAQGLEVAIAGIVPLRQMLDDLTGMPEVIASHSAIWTAMSTDLHGLAADLRGCLDRDLSDVDGPAARAYLAMMAHNVEALTGLADVATAMAVITKTAGDLILLTRDIVRGLIADLFARTIVWASASEVVPLPVTVSRLATAVATAWRIHAYVTALVTSMTRLSQYVDD